MSKSWKAAELSWRSIGGTRAHFEQFDVSHPLFAIESKLRDIKGYPTTVRKWMEQAVSATPEGKIPLLAIHLKGETRGNDLVVIRRSDFEDLYGRLKPQESPSIQPQAGDNEENDVRTYPLGEKSWPGSS
jgi:hypothetical protein